MFGSPRTFWQRPSPALAEKATSLPAPPSNICTSGWSGDAPITPQRFAARSWRHRHMRRSVALGHALALALVLAAPADAQSPPLQNTLDLDVLGTPIHLELRIGPSPPEPSQPAVPFAGRPPLSAVRPSTLTFDEQVSEVARVAPSFGGFFIDEAKDTLYVYMKLRGTSSPSGTAALRRAVTAVSEAIVRRFRIPTHRVKVLEADYTWQRLAAWYGPLAERMPTGTVRTGIDERANRINVGVTSTSAAAAVRRRLASLQIPARAVDIERMQRPSNAVGLSNRQRPMVGGLQISRPISATDISRCTIGLFGYSDRQSRWGFITNSHCTSSKGGVDGTRFYQPQPSNKTFLGRPGTDFDDAGTEVDDPPWPRDCWYWGTYRRCRASDSAFVALPSWYNDGSWEKGYSHGTIAGMHPGTTEYNGWYYDSGLGRPAGAWWVAGIDRYPVDGRALDKVGRTTGRTVGNINDTCSEIHMEDGTRVKCTYQATNWMLKGDSGSPVFYFLPGREGQVGLTGLGFGANDGEMIFTPIGQVEKDLGHIWLCRFDVSTSSC